MLLAVSVTALLKVVSIDHTESEKRKKDKVDIWCLLLTCATIDESIVPLESAVIISGIDRLQHRSHLSAGTS